MRRSAWIAAAALIVAPAAGAWAQTDETQVGDVPAGQGPGEAEGTPGTAQAGTAGATEGDAQAEGPTDPDTDDVAADGDAEELESGVAPDGAAGEGAAGEDAAAGGAAAQQGGAQAAPAGDAAAQAEEPAQPPAPQGTAQQPAAPEPGATGRVAQPQQQQQQQQQRRQVGTPQIRDNAWRRLLSPDLDVAARADTAAQQLAVAELALAEEDVENAQSSLQLANQSLQAILTGAPGARLASSLGDAAAQLQLPDGPLVDLASLAEQVRQLDPVLPDEVVTLVGDAERQLGQGELDAATRSLLGARNWILADMALLPAEQAYVRSRAALAELEAGNLQLARDLVQGAPASIVELRSSAPLVPVSLRLRAAAHQAQERQWAQAEMLLNEASNELLTLRGDASAALSRRIDRLYARLGVLQERLATGRQPSARSIRNVADAAVGTPAG